MREQPDVFGARTAALVDAPPVPGGVPPNACCVGTALRAPVPAPEGTLKWLGPARGRVLVKGDELPPNLPLAWGLQLFSDWVEPRGSIASESETAISPELD